MLAYVNNLPNASNFETRLFADDTALLLSDENLIALNKVNSELLKVKTWLNANKLTLNYAKTKYLLIKPETNSSQLCKFTLTIKGIKLQKCQSAKYLGIIPDENLTWEPHIQYLEKKNISTVGIIAKMRHYLNHENLIALYYVFFYSHLLFFFSCVMTTLLKVIQTPNITQ